MPKRLKIHPLLYPAAPTAGVAPSALASCPVAELAEATSSPACALGALVFVGKMLPEGQRAQAGLPSGEWPARTGWAALGLKVTLLGTFNIELNGRRAGALVPAPGQTAL